jgi:hypothetical protein
MPSPFGLGSDHYAVVSAMITPAFFLTATASLLVSSNSRLARVVDRMRQQIAELNAASDPIERARLESRIALHRKRARMVLHSLQMLYGAISAFVGTSLALAGDAFLGFRLGVVPTVMAILGALFLLGASFAMWREVSLSVRSFDLELDQEMSRMRG